MKIKNREHYDDCKAKNTDPCGKEIFRYAEVWADLMEAEMVKGATLSDMAERTSHEADTEDITGFMYGIAVNFLYHVWEHGDALRRWHNKKTQIGTEGDEANENDGVLNPALLIMEKKT